MRIEDLKFRLWDKKEKKIIKEEIKYFKKGKFIFSLNGILGRYNYDEPCEQERYIIMQYTGLKDKKGKEIYEGDIIKCKWKDDYVIVGNLVEFLLTSGNPIFRYMKDKTQTHLACAIIGNIYENPELLERKND